MYKNVTNDINARRNVTPSYVFWDDAFTPFELCKIIAICDTELVPGTTIGTQKDLEKAKHTRRSMINFIHPKDNTQWIFDRLNSVVDTVNDRWYNYDLWGYNTLQYTEYYAADEGTYDWHMDFIHDDSKPYGNTRKLSFTLLLEDPLKGGEFLLNIGSERGAKIPEMKVGRIIFFPSYVIHKVAPVTEGTRKSLVGWVLGPKFR